MKKECVIIEKKSKKKSLEGSCLDVKMFMQLEIFLEWKMLIK